MPRHPLLRDWALLCTSLAADPPTSPPSVHPPNGIAAAVIRQITQPQATLVNLLAALRQGERGDSLRVPAGPNCPLACSCCEPCTQALQLCPFPRLLHTPSLAPRFHILVTLLAAAFFRYPSPLPVLHEGAIRDLCPACSLLHVTP